MIKRSVYLSLCSWFCLFLVLLCRCFLLLLCCVASHLPVDAVHRYFTFLVECKEPKACTILLRGASKDILSEVECNLQDALNVACNIMIDHYLCPGGGASEMAVAQVGLCKLCMWVCMIQWSPFFLTISMYRGNRPSLH